MSYQIYLCYMSDVHTYTLVYSLSVLVCVLHTRYVGTEWGVCTSLCIVHEVGTEWGVCTNLCTVHEVGTEWAIHTCYPIHTEVSTYVRIKWGISNEPHSVHQHTKEECTEKMMTLVGEVCECTSTWRTQRGVIARHIPCIVESTLTTCHPPILTEMVAQDNAILSTLYMHVCSSPSTETWCDTSTHSLSKAHLSTVCKQKQQIENNLTENNKRSNPWIHLWGLKSDRWFHLGHKKRDEVWNAHFW
jgi:hypothetical protein